MSTIHGFQMIPHGTSDGYGYFRCRCDACCAWHRAYRASRTPFRRAHRKDVDSNGVNPHAPHGSTNGYDLYCCRCGPCSTAKKVAGRELRARKLAQRVQAQDGRLVHPGAPHGTGNGYVHWGCRCELCADAQAKRSAARRERRSQKNKAAP